MLLILAKRVILIKTIKDNSKSTRLDITNLAIEQEKLEEMVDR